MPSRVEAHDGLAIADRREAKSASSQRARAALAAACGATSNVASPLSTGHSSTAAQDRVDTGTSALATKKLPSLSSRRLILLVCGAAALLATAVAVIVESLAPGVIRQIFGGRSSSTRTAVVEPAAAASAQRRRQRRPPRARQRATSARNSSAAAAAAAELPSDFDPLPWQSSPRYARLLAMCDNAPLARGQLPAATTAAPAAATSTKNSSDGGGDSGSAGDENEESQKSRHRAGDDDLEQAIAAKVAARAAEKALRAEDARLEYCASHDMARNCSLTRRAKWQQGGGRGSAEQVAAAAATVRARAPVFIKTHKVSCCRYVHLRRSDDDAELFSVRERVWWSVSSPGRLALPWLVTIATVITHTHTHTRARATQVGGTTFGSLLQAVAGKVFLDEADAADAAELPDAVRGAIFGLRECDFAKSFRLGRSANCGTCVYIDCKPRCPPPSPPPASID
jgi:hypothetical protein